MPKPKPCILAVDDDVQVLSLVRDALEMEGYRVITADSGEAAMAAIEQQLSDLVVLDIMLPGIDGYARLPAHPQLLPGADNNADGEGER